MNMQCSCGFDYSDFVKQHSIPAHSRFACPNCEAQVTSGGEENPAGAALGTDDPAVMITGPAAPQETLAG